MPDLPDRRQREQELAAVLLLLWDDWGRWISASSPRSAPWDRMQNSIANSSNIRDVLVLIFVSAAQQLGEEKGFSLDEQILIAQARRWADVYLPALALEIAKNTRESLISGADLETVLSPDRAAAIGITETTRSISLGEWVAADLAANLTLIGDESLKPFWFTEADGRVCEVCGPLHGEGKDVWGARFPFGPGAHPRCRCWLEWR